MNTTRAGELRLAEDNPQDRERTLRASRTSNLVKPVNFGRLLDAVRDLE